MHKVARAQHFAVAKQGKREWLPTEVEWIGASGSTFGSGATYADRDPLEGSGPTDTADV